MVTKIQASVVIVALSAILGLSTKAAADTVPPNAIQAQAQRNIVNGAAVLTKVAYVTSKSHTKTEWVEGKILADDSFTLTYKFFYRDSDNDPQTYTLRFICTKTGKIDKIDIVNHSSFWQPFNAIIIAGGVLDGIAKDLNK